MAISPIQITRISHQLQSDLVVSSLQRNQRGVFAEQTRIATGRDFVTPSENPVAAARAFELRRASEQQIQFMGNLRHADNFIAAADAALSEVNGLLVEAANIASENVSNLTSAAERESVAELIAGIRIQLQNVGNRQFDNRYLFGGRDTTARPFVEALGGVAYVGDVGHLFTRTATGRSEAINLPGSELFGALSSRLASSVDLSPRLDVSTRLDELTGAAGRGIQGGTLVINEVGGAGAVRVDLSGADTVGDVVDRINAASTADGANFSASLSDVGLVITPGGLPISVTDTSTGVIAADLGVLNPAPTTSPITGLELGARLTMLTPLSALALGQGIDLTGGLRITNGPRSVTVDLSGSLTVQDVIQRINSAGVFVSARINEDGTAIDLFNLVSGTALTVGENGGTAAANLGIRTFDRATPLDRLNSGIGVITVDGLDDFRITTSGGSTVDVNLDGAVTIGDVLDRINAAATAAGAAVTASLADVGNGIRIIDGGSGTGALTVSRLNLSQAAQDLGLLDATVNSGGNELIGSDRHPVRTNGVLSVLVELEDALRRDDTQAIALAAERLDPLTKDTTRVHGVVGARAQAMRSKLNQMEDAADTTRIVLSEIEDVDYADAITRMQASMTELQANLQVSSALLGVSLLDFLR